MLKFKHSFYLLGLISTLTMAEPLDKVIAIVNDGVITASELNKEVTIARQQLAATKMPIPSEQALRKQVLQHLIDVDLELQLAKENGLAIDNAELSSTIEKIASNNKLSLSQMREAVVAQGLSWQTYRENIRKELLINRVQQKAIGKEVTVSPQQVEDYLKIAAEQDKNQYTYHLQNILVPLPEEPSSEQVKDAQRKMSELLQKIKTGSDFSRLAIEQSNDTFSLEGGDLGERHLAELPELFANQVVKMKVGQVAGPLRAGNGLQLIKLVAINGSDGKHEIVKTHVRHILLKQDATMTSEEASRQAQNLYQQLKSGKDFATMAKNYSLDVGSGAKGGDLGWVDEGELVPQFEKAMKALPLHTVSKPVKTPYGWHLIEVLERKKIDDSETFKRQQVRLFLQQRKFAEAVQNWQQHLRTDAYVKIMDKALA